MMKKLEILWVFLLLCPALYSNSRMVNVDFKDNTSVGIELSSDLVMQFTDDELVFKSEKTNNRFSFGDILGFYYSNIATSIEEDCLSETFILTGNELRIVGLEKGATVKIYDMQGICLSDVRVDGEFQMDLSLLHSGVYVVTYNNTSRKIIVTRN